MCRDEGLLQGDQAVRLARQPLPNLCGHLRRRGRRGCRVSVDCAGPAHWSGRRNQDEANNEEDVSGCRQCQLERRSRGEDIDMVSHHKKRQAGWGRKRHSRKSGGRLRRRRRRSQRGRGPRWNRFKSWAKSGLRRTWKKIAPGMVSAGRRAIPHAVGILTSKHSGSHKRRAAAGLAKKFGKDIVRSMIR